MSMGLDWMNLPNIQYNKVEVQGHFSLKSSSYIHPQKIKKVKAARKKLYIIKN